MGRDKHHMTTSQGVSFFFFYVYSFVVSLYNYHIFLLLGKDTTKLFPLLLGHLNKVLNKIRLQRRAAILDIDSSLVVPDVLPTITVSLIV